MNDIRSRTDLALLADLLAGWREHWQGQALFRVTAGEDWVRLHLEGNQRPGILLTGLPGASLVFSHEGRLPGPVDKALTPIRHHPLSKLLAETSFSTCGMFPADRVAAFSLTSPAGEPVYLLHQLFGARGNTVLLDGKARLLWSRHRPPHSLLTTIPPKAVWKQGTAGEKTDQVSATSLNHLTSEILRQSLQQTRSALNQRLKSTRRLVDNLSRDFSSAEKGELYRRKAEALATHLHNLSQGADSVELSDPRNGEALSIALDPALSPPANMEAWFRKARKADKGRDVIAARLADAHESAASLTAAEDKLNQVSDATGSDEDRLSGLQDWREHHADLLPGKKRRSPDGRHGPEEPARPFRRYLIDGRWEVWVGRNNKENDQLTHRAAHVNDIWLHAQGVSGSHVILRTGGKPENVPKAVLEKAASLAAMNSKARHSELVPVIHTERRYVRKPRKAPTGTAVCLREKSIFVTPEVAPGVVSI